MRTLLVVFAVTVFWGCQRSIPATLKRSPGTSRTQKPTVRPSPKPSRWRITPVFCRDGELFVVTEDSSREHWVDFTKEGVERRRYFFSKRDELLLREVVTYTAGDSSVHVVVFSKAFSGIAFCPEASFVPGKGKRPKVTLLYYQAGHPLAAPYYREADSILAYCRNPNLSLAASR